MILKIVILGYSYRSGSTDAEYHQIRPTGTPALLWNKINY
jgi:hypothetical protein